MTSTKTLLNGIITHTDQIRSNEVEIPRENNALHQNENLLKHFTTSLHAFDSTTSKNLMEPKIRATVTSNRISGFGCEY